MSGALVSPAEARKLMCPFSAPRATPFACRGPLCMAWRWSLGGMTPPEQKGLVGWCGQVDEPIWTTEQLQEIGRRAGARHERG